MPGRELLPNANRDSAMRQWQLLPAGIGETGDMLSSTAAAGGSHSALCDRGPKGHSGGGQVRSPDHPRKCLPCRLCHDVHLLPRWVVLPSCEPDKPLPQRLLLPSRQHRALQVSVAVIMPHWICLNRVQLGRISHWCHHYSGAGGHHRRLSSSLSSRGARRPR